VEVRGRAPKHEELHVDTCSIILDPKR